MLENGLEALLIRDEKTDKAAGALDVKAGHLADPEDLQGLAHFCEHLLFMGTDKVSIVTPRAQPPVTWVTCPARRRVASSRADCAALGVHAVPTRE